MDLKSCLKLDDLFISFWLDNNLTIISGNHTDVLSVEQKSAKRLKALINEFECCVSKVDYYTTFISTDRRPISWPHPVTSPTEIHDLLIQISSQIFTPKLREYIFSGRYGRLLLFPDGILNALPLERLFLGDCLSQVMPKGVVYAPSASAYAYANKRRRKKQFRHALILIGDRDDESMIEEAQKVVQCIPCHCDVVATRAELQRQTEKADLLYIISHGTAPGDQEAYRDWAIMFEDGTLDVEDFYKERIRLSRGSTVVLSACSVGRLVSGPAHQIDGLIHALFYGGAATILAARWPVLYEAAEAVFKGTIQEAILKSIPISVALLNSVTNPALLETLRPYMAFPESELFFLGPFALFGCGD